MKAQIAKNKVVTLLFFLIPILIYAETIGIFYQKNNPQHSFAAQTIRNVIETNGDTVELLDLFTKLTNKYPHKKVVIYNRHNNFATNFLISEGGSLPKETKSEGFSIITTNKNRTSYYVIGQDDSGVIYGGNKLSSMLLQGQKKTKNLSLSKAPHVNTRGIKFNIPLDARTPSYSDDGTAAWENVVHMWDMDFWIELIDELAENYYNTITLWSLNPFPSIVKTPGFPNAALDDVYKANTIWEADQEAKNMYNNQVANNLVKVKTMTIDQKIKHWQDVMAYGKSRGIKFYIMTWNIYPVALVNSGYDIKSDVNNSTTKAYYKNSVKATFETYPDLAGMGVSAGEKLGRPRASSKEVGKWLFDTYGAAIAEVKKENPNRKIKFIHREHYTKAPQIDAQWKDWYGYNTPGEFDFSFKYEVAHMHASSNPGYINSFLRDRLPNGKKTWITVRNDDHYYMRWGDPDYARDYVNNFPPKEQLEGAYIGPDGYIWGREFVSKNHTTGKRQLVVNKFWYTMKIFGRLMYDPSTPNSFFKNELEKKFPGVNKEKLFSAWQSVSKITPLLNRFHWGPSDHMFYPELCYSDRDEFHDLRDFLNEEKYDPMKPWEDGDRPNIMSIEDFIKGQTGKITPLEVANSLEIFGNDGLKDIATVQGGNRELNETIVDIKMMGTLGKYYAMKIRAAVELDRFEKLNNTSSKTKGIEYAKEASIIWADYAELMSSQYKGQIFTRLGTKFVDANILQKEVDADIDIIRNAGENNPGNNIALNFITPNAGATFPSGKNLEVEVSTTGGNVSNVKLYLNNNFVRQESNAPYQWSAPSDTVLSNLADGVYELKAVATDTNGSSSEKAITIAVGNANAPSVSFSKPTNNEIFQQGQNVSVTVIATDNGSIANVKLYLDNILVRQENNAPYNWGGNNDTILQNMTPGTYILKAVAKDNTGLTTTKTISFTVSDAPNTSCELPWSRTNMSINNTILDWESNNIDISCGTNVMISMDIEGLTPEKMEPADYLNIYYSIDGGAKIEIAKRTDGFARTTVSANNITGTNIKLFIEGKTSYTDETYTITNIKIIETPSLGNRSSEDIKNNKTFNISPNPISENEILINFVKPFQSEKTKLKIYTLNGELLFQKKLKPKNKGAIKIDLPPSLSNGIYMLTIQSLDVKSTKKIIIKR